MNRRQLPPGTRAQQAPRNQQPQTHGPVDRVPCAHCGKPLDMRNLQSQQLLDTGHELACEHCGRMNQVAGIRVVTVVSLRQSTRQPRRSDPEPREARTISPQQLRRLTR